MASHNSPHEPQTLPAAVQAVTGTQLVSMGAVGLSDFAAKVPGLNIFNAGSNQIKLKLRGISSASESEPQETVGVYLDDVPITGSGGTNNENGASPDLGLVDMERIEVLKGPQGTLYGAGSLGGTLRYITRQPDLENFAAHIQPRFSSTEHGSWSRRVDTMLNIPLIKERLAFRVAGSVAHDAGWLDNPVSAVGVGLSPSGTGKADLNSDNNSLVRATLAFAATDKLTMRARYMRRDYEVNGKNSIEPMGDSFQKPWAIEPYNNDTLDLGDFLMDYRFEGGTLTSSTSFLSRTTHSLQDATKFNRTVVFTMPTAPAAGLWNDNKQEDFVQELRYAFSMGEHVKGVNGLYYSKQNKQFTQDTPIPGLNEYLLANNATPIPTFPTITPGINGIFPNAYQSNVPQELEQHAIFGELTYSPIKQVDIILGGRYFFVNQQFNFQSRGLFSAPVANYRGAKGCD